MIQPPPYFESIRANAAGQWNQLKEVIFFEQLAQVYPI